MAPEPVPPERRPGGSTLPQYLTHTSIGHPMLFRYRILMMLVFVCQAKTDQEGDNASRPKHVYANLIMPEICPILALGIYLLVDIRPNQTDLFQGNNQADRFRHIRFRTCSNTVVNDRLESFGFDSTKLGIQSTRKGSATFCMGGSSEPPSQSSIDHRGGWSDMWSTEAGISREGNWGPTRHQDNLSRQDIPAKVGEILEARAIQANSVTPQLLRELLAEHYTQMMLDPTRVPSAEPAAAPEASNQVPIIRQLYMWSGGLRLLPEHYALPKVGLRLIWQYWWFGNDTDNIPALRYVTPKDLVDFRRLSDLKFIVNAMLKSLHPIDQTPNLSQANSMYEAAILSLNLYDPSESGGNRRVSQQI